MQPVLANMNQPGVSPLPQQKLAGARAAHSERSASGRDAQAGDARRGPDTPGGPHTCISATLEQKSPNTTKCGGWPPALLRNPPDREPRQPERRGRTPEPRAPPSPALPANRGSEAAPGLSGTAAPTTVPARAPAARRGSASRFPAPQGRGTGWRRGRPGARSERPGTNSAAARRPLLPSPGPYRVAGDRDCPEAAGEAAERTGRPGSPRAAPPRPRPQLGSHWPLSTRPRPATPTRAGGGLGRRCRAPRSGLPL